MTKLVNSTNKHNGCPGHAIDTLYIFLRKCQTNYVTERNCHATVIPTTFCEQNYLVTKETFAQEQDKITTVHAITTHNVKTNLLHHITQRYRHAMNAQEINLEYYYLTRFIFTNYFLKP